MTHLRTVEHAGPLFPGSDFQKHLSDCMELSGRELETAKKLMYNYIVTIGKALEHPFVEWDFIVKNTAFLDPTMRSLQRPDLPCKFHAGNVPFGFDCSKLYSQYRMYENDVTTDFQYELCGKFWCQLYMEEEYEELASLALLPLSVTLNFKLYYRAICYWQCLWYTHTNYLMISYGEVQST